MISLDELSDDLKLRLSEIRAHLHTYPELSFEEYETAKFIESQLKSLGVSDIRRIGNTGVTALIQGKHPDKRCIALRADMDALPIHETNDVPYKSKHEGVMHACGHDVHSTCLLGAAELLIAHRNRFEGTIKLIFQPGEEKSPGGASILIQEGILKNPEVTAIAALHVAPDLPCGTAGFRTGAYMASADEVHITLKGKPGHAAMPHLAVDTISMAAQLITSLQQVFSRTNDPLNPSVLSFAMISGGHTTNVIPAEVTIKGTFRTFDEGWRQQALQTIEHVCQSVCTPFGGDFDLNIPPGYPSLFNDVACTKVVSEQIAQVIGSERIQWLPMRTTSEDFSFYTQQIPGCFFRLGTNENGNKYTASVHSSNFDVVEESIHIGAVLMANAGLALLSMTT